MELLELMKNRYSVRQFEKKQIEQEKLEKILEAGRVAPTACNRQPQRILVLQTKENLEKLETCTKFTFQAPTVLMVCADKATAWTRKQDEKNHGQIDVSIVTTQMVLEAFSLGIGSCFVCAFDEEKIRQTFAIPQNYEVVTLLPLGYPAGKPAEGHSIRKPKEETIFYENY